MQQFAGCVADPSAINVDPVMPALVAGIHVLLRLPVKGVDGRDKPGHDGDG